jgi:MFS family permease
LSSQTLLRNRDFLKLWSAQTVSLFGSLITRAALPFLAVLVLAATPAQLAALRVADLLPGFLIGLVAGVWVDRLRRRPVMIIADLGRAIALGMIPFLAFIGQLKLFYLYVIAVIASGLTVFFDVAQQAYLPAVVESKNLGDANSRIAATQSAVEISAFGIAGWLVQLLTAPVAIAVDAATFVISAIFVGSIRTAERRQHEHEAAGALWAEMVEGLRLLGSNGSLRAIGVSVAAMEAGFGLSGTVYALYALRELGIPPGPLGLIYALGGVSALAGSLLTPRINRRFGIGRSMAAGLLVGAFGFALLPIAAFATAFSWLFLGAQQLIGDGGLVVFGINEITVRQLITPAEALGRITAGVRVAGLGAMLLGALLGGLLGQVFGLRFALAVSALLLVIAAAAVIASPLRRLRRFE